MTKLQIIAEQAKIIREEDEKILKLEDKIRDLKELEKLLHSKKD